MTLLRLLVFVSLGIAVAVAGGLPWYEQIQLQKIKAGGIPSAGFFALGFMDKPQAEMATGWLHGLPYNSNLIERQLERAILARPLYPDHKLLLAKVKQRLGKYEEASRLAEDARKLGPTRAYLLWDLTMFWLTMSDRDRAISTLHDYLMGKPWDVQKVLFVAYRFEVDKARLLKKLIPSEIVDGYDYDQDYYPARVLRSALRLKNAELARLAWSTFQNQSLEDNVNATIIKHYLRFLIKNNFRWPAKNIWEEAHARNIFSGEIVNSGFEYELLEYGFGWRTKHKTIQSERVFEEAVAGNYSLKIPLDGAGNINLFVPAISIPVEEGARYQLSIFWKGEGVTTRSNPFLEVVYNKADSLNKIRLSSSKQRRGTWEWERVNLEFDVPIGTHFVDLRLRRKSTEALDSHISGLLYLDDAELTRYNSYDTKFEYE